MYYCINWKLFSIFVCRNFSILVYHSHISKVAGYLSTILTLSITIDELKSVDYQLEEVIDFLVGDYLVGDTRGEVIAKYLYAKDRVTELIDDGDITYKYERKGWSLIPERTSIAWNPEQLDQLKKEIEETFK